MTMLRSQVIRRLHLSIRHLDQPSISRTYQSCSYASFKALPYGHHFGSECYSNNRPFSGFGSRSIVTCSFKLSGILGDDVRGESMAGYVKVVESRSCLNEARWMSTARVPAGAQKVSLKVTMLSPGFIYEPYAPREPISFWRRWFTRSGWRRTKEDILLEMKNAFAIARLRKATGYSRKNFYGHAIGVYKEINTIMANGDASSLRKVVTEKMYSNLKNELKRRKSIWRSVHWELLEPVINIRTLRARMIALDKDDLNKSFIQLTIEFTSKQRFEAYDSKGAVVAGDKSKEVLVRDIWVFERSLFHPGAEWRLCGRIGLPTGRP